MEKCTAINKKPVAISSTDASSNLSLPFANEGIQCGFPSPAQDYLDEALDLNKIIVKHQETTFYARIRGDSMQEQGIFDGDLAVIDKSLEARDGNLVVAFVEGDFTIKTFRMDPSGEFAWLIPANPAYKPIKASADNDFMVWGVVTHTIHKHV